MFANNRIQLSAMSIMHHMADPQIHIYSLPAALRPKYTVNFPIDTPAANTHR